MILFKRSDSRLTMPTRCCSSSCKRHQAAQFLDGAGHGRQRLADFVRDGRGQTPERRHAFLGGHFLLEALQVRQVLEIKHVSGRAALSRAQRGDRNSDESLLAIGRHEIHFAALGKLAVFGRYRPEARKTGHISCMSVPRTSPKLAAGDFFSRPVQQENAAVHVRGEQAAAHGMNNVLVERLQVLQVPRA